MLKEELEFMGPVRVRDVEEAQQRVVSIVRRMEEAGEIVISRGGEEEMLI
jgi:flagellar motor switch protein FliG